ncbi:ABC transporter substrate-binding protein [Alicyclobacillus fastidiosus]|uniref:ABC transporter substrate-binding protein n=2 Tax=Alicyclobacillus fastidiosus TaxID=392011 RepID=A0ABY6ZHV4_9BACL|nr:ABC transporter substrate-binding protein [Alicyclobacillus fastidiosus]WAH42488.1 ABC transporter substrate-binding protein [Alicyclobacillus fastidiosus]
MNSGWKRGITGLLSIGALGLMLTGCGTSTGNNGGTGEASTITDNEKPQMGGNLTLDLSQAVPDVDPAIGYDTTSSEILYQLYEPLVTYKKNTYQIVGDLAKSYDVSADGLTYTFHLRQGVKFWNNDPMTSKDFVFELERILNPNMKPNPSPGSSFFMDIAGAQAYYNGQTKTISGVSTPNDSTLVIKLVKPESFFLQVLALPFLSAVDPKFVNKVGNAAFNTTEAMGTGPFELVTNNQSQVVLKRNPNYWQKDQYGNQLPYLNQITFNVNSNTQLDEMHWEQGQTGFLSPWVTGGNGIPTSSYPSIMGNPQYSKLVQKQAENSVAYVGLNVSKTLDGKANPLSNIDVRKAIEYAFNDQQIVKLNNGAVLPLNQPLPSGMPGYVQHLNSDATYTFNLTKAKQLLKQAGYTHGLTLTLWDQNTPDARKMDQAFQSMMQQIGITVKINEVSWSDFLAKEMSGDAQMFWGGWSQDFPDPSDFLNTLFNSNQRPQNNNTMYDNAQVDAWLNEAEYMTNQSQRNALYGKVTNQVMADATWVPVYQFTGYYAVQSWVHGFYTSPVLFDPFQYIWIDQNHSS